jgi:hypothetical protein
MFVLTYLNVLFCIVCKIILAKKNMSLLPVSVESYECNKEGKALIWSLVSACCCDSKVVPRLSA